MKKNNGKFFKFSKRCILEDSESSLNSFKQNKILSDESNDYQILDLIKLNKNKISKIKEIENSSLENLLDELESLKKVCYELNNKDYASNEIKKIKQKIAYLIYRKSFYSINENNLELNNENLKKIVNLFENDLDLKKIINSLENEITMKKIFDYFDCYYKININNLISDLELKKNENLFFNLILLKKKFSLIDILLKKNFIEFDQTINKYFSILIDKELLKLRKFSNELNLIEKIQLQLNNQRLGNLSLMNKLNTLSKKLIN